MAELYVFDRAAIREVDRRAVEEFGIPGIVLMENAARGVAVAALQRVDALAERAGFAAVHGRPRVAVVICCGRGNNGGDGLAAARHLHNAGVSVALVLASETWEYAGDAAINAQAALRMGLPMQVAHVAGVRDAFHTACAAATRGAAGAGRPRPAPGALGAQGEAADASSADNAVPLLIIDALLGTGASKMVETSSTLAHVVDVINQTRRGALPRPSGGARETGEKPSPADRDARLVEVLSVDVPSGIDCDTGRPLVRRPDGTTTAVYADTTVTLVGWKRGFLKSGGGASGAAAGSGVIAPAVRPFVGEIVVADIGAPAELSQRFGKPITLAPMPAPASDCPPLRSVTTGEPSPSGAAAIVRTGPQDVRLPSQEGQAASERISATTRPRNPRRRGGRAR